MDSGKTLSEIKIFNRQFYFRKRTNDEVLVRDNIMTDRPEYPFPRTLKPKIVWDIGANIGVVSVRLANLYPEAHIFAFEPQRENYHILSKNISGYKNITAVQVALSNTDGEMKLYHSDCEINMGGFSLQEEGCDTSKFEMVPVMSTSKAVGSFAFPSLIKIDCEGAEYDILSEFRNHLKRIDYIVGELHGKDDWDLMKLLSEYFDLGMSKNLESRIGYFNARKKGLAAI